MYKIKPLVWEKLSAKFHGTWRWRANILFQGYYVINDRGTAKHIFPNSRYEVFCQVDNNHKEWTQYYGSITECKEAAQAHLEKSLKEMLEEVKHDPV